MKILDLFDFLTGNAEALEKISDGNIPLVYGTSENNGIEKYVDVDANLIFNPPLITVSYLGTAFVQTVPFTTSVVDKSNIIILQPKQEMTLVELYFYCFQINRHGKFGFSYGRRMNMARLGKLEIKVYDSTLNSTIGNVSVQALKPSISISKDTHLSLLNVVPVEHIFYVHNAKSQAFSNYDLGNIPFVSNGFINKGIIGYVKPECSDRVFTKNNISISAFCEAIVQDKPFIARGNGGSGLCVLEPKANLSKSILLEYAAYINQSWKWRFHYGRMVSIERIKKLQLPELI